MRTRFYEKELEYIEENLKANPEDNSMLIAKGNFLYELGRYEKALECHEKALEKDSLNEGILFNIGNDMEELGRNEKAMEFYNKALEIDNKFVSAIVNRGNLLFRMEKYAEAFSCFMEAPLDSHDEDLLANIEIIVHIYSNRIET